MIHHNHATMKYVYSIALTLLVMPSISGKAQGTSAHYETYCNSKYSYCVDYPDKILVPQGESGSGDGQVFESKDKENTLTVYRDLRDNMDPDVKFDIASAYRDDIDVTESRTPKTVTYKKLGKTFYVVSGYEGKKIYYQKTFLSGDGQLVTCRLVYAERDKTLYSPLLDHIMKSLR